MNFSLGIEPAAALYMTLPDINVPSIFNVKTLYPKKGAGYGVCCGGGSRNC